MANPWVMRYFSPLATIALLCGYFAAACAPGLADVSVAAGGYTQGAPAGAGGALLVSSGAAIPAFPLELQGTLLVPLTPGGGYAATAEIRGFTGGGFGGAYVGAGAGVGDLASDRSSGAVLTLFAGKSITDRLSIEVRGYKQLNDTGAAAAFIGLRLSL